MTKKQRVEIVTDSPDLRAILEAAEPMVDQVLMALAAAGVPPGRDACVAVMWAAARSMADSNPGNPMTVSAFEMMAGTVMHIERAAVLGEKTVTILQRPAPKGT